LSSLGTWTEDQATDSPDEFASSFKLTCTSADASPAAGDVAYIRYMFEGNELQGLAYGTSSAKDMTLSFWVKSNKTGSATVQLLQNDNSSKNLSPSYTINSADTWEYKTISIPADTAGSIDNDNGPAVSLIWWLNSGSNYSSGSNQTTWSTYSATDSNASNLGVGGTDNDYFQITGVQLEVGDTATPFEHRSYGEELKLCERYYQKFDNNSQFHIGRTLSSNRADFTFPFRTEMRATPTVLDYSSGNIAGYSVDGAYSPFTLDTTQAGGDGIEIVHSCTSYGSIRIWATDSISSTNRPICIQVSKDVAFGAEL